MTTNWILNKRLPDPLVTPASLLNHLNSGTGLLMLVLFVVFSGWMSPAVGPLSEPAVAGMSGLASMDVCC